ncbi:MAG TPA: hypothetical protein VMS76_12695 [Planctomycetota bacterium]|nr:hypothetical protein [Planctomycetota bacterium]
MGELARLLAGLLGSSVLVALPGAWITFGLPLVGAAFWLRLCTGCVLSPVVLFAQYYLLRAIGLDFDGALLALIAVNLPALALLVHRWKQGHGGPGLERGELGWALALLAVPIACLVLPALFQPRDFPYWLHSWVHSGTIYLLANGELIPEESRLAGIRYATPWTAHLFQGLVSRALGHPPAVVYLPLNVLWMVLITALVGGMARSLGGGARARTLSWIGLWFGINLVGYLLRSFVFPQGWESRHLFGDLIFGDVRYTPWLWKFRFLEHVVFGLGLVAALPHFLLRIWRPGRGVGGDLAIVLLLLCGVVFSYPLLAPAAFVLVAGCAVLLLAVRRWENGVVPRSRAWWLAALLVVAGAVGLANLKLLVADRYYGTGGPERPIEALRKLVQFAIVTLPLLAAAVLHLRARWRERPRAAAILGVGGLGSLLLYIGLDLPTVEVEYKYMFSAGVALAPFFGVVCEPWLARAGARQQQVAFATCLAFAVPFVLKVTSDWSWHWPKGEKPALDLSRFELRLAASEPGAAVYAELREATPVDTVLVADAPRLDMTALTGRALYAPEDHEEVAPGVMLGIDHLVAGVRGHDRALIRRRSEVRRALYEGKEAEREAALAKIGELGRPVAVLLDLREEAHRELLAWLEGTARGRMLAKDGSVAAWCVGEGTGAAEEDDS